MYHRVFVYGTLLRDQVNHHLLAGAEYLGPHRTVPRFALCNLGTYPGLIQGGGTAVSGEVYRVDGRTLALIDRLEEQPRLYRRRLLPTPYGLAWVYLWRVRGAAPTADPGSIRRPRRIPSGDWRDLTQDPGSLRARAIRTTRNPKNRPRRADHPRP
jgi:gamma-glutamylcyclotransferase (GGCT)/AIG2-like uncharacterized protein YtfP